MRNGQMPYFHFYPQDWWGSDAVSAMCATARGGYIELLCRAWVQPEPGVLPDEDEKLRRWSKLSREEWLEVRDEIRAAFRESSRDGAKVLVQNRLRQEHAKLTKVLENRSRGARVTNEKRWGLGRSTTRTPNRSAIAFQKSEVRSQKSENIDHTLLVESISVHPGAEVAFTLTSTQGPYSISRAQFARWSELFPGVDLMRELRAMEAWLEANPSRRKTPRGMLRFAASWLSRAQDSPRKPNSQDAIDQFLQKHGGKS